MSVLDQEGEPLGEWCHRETFVKGRKAILTYAEAQYSQRVALVKDRAQIGQGKRGDEREKRSVQSMRRAGLGRVITGLEMNLCRLQAVCNL